MVNSSVSKSIVMSLDDWARAVSIAKKYNQKSLSKVMAIAIRRVYVDSVLKK